MKYTLLPVKLITPYCLSLFQSWCWFLMLPSASTTEKAIIERFPVQFYCCLMSAWRKMHPCTQIMLSYWMFYSVVKHKASTELYTVNSKWFRTFSTNLATFLNQEMFQETATFEICIVFIVLCTLAMSVRVNVCPLGWSRCWCATLWTPLVLLLVLSKGQRRKIK